ncbi:hypothetical protein QQ045_031094 [Rhodiola kirilowii]
MADDFGESQRFQSFRFPAAIVESDDNDSVRLTPEYSPQDDIIEDAYEAAAQRYCTGDDGEGLINNVRVDSFGETWVGGGAERIDGASGRLEVQQQHSDGDFGRGSRRFRATPPFRHKKATTEDLRGRFRKEEDCPRTPTFHASTLGIWHAFVSYDACFRLCLNAWSRGCSEAPIFLENECALLRNAFGLQKVLLQPEEELLTNHSPALSQEMGSASTPRRTAAKIRVQVRKVKVIPDTPVNLGPCSIKAFAARVRSTCHQLCDMHSAFSSVGKSSSEAHFAPRASDADSSSSLSSEYIKSPIKYIKHMLKFRRSHGSGNKVTPNAEVQENYSCKLRLKSYHEMDTILAHPWSSESLIFYPESLADDLIIEVLDSKGKTFGCVLAQLAIMSEDSVRYMLSWYPIYRDSDHKLVGRLQLHITSTKHEDYNHLKCGSVAETLAYDLVIETAMKEQHFHQRKLLLNESWTWLLGEFASYYGVSDLYTKLRYVLYIMEVATPTAYCLSLVYDLLMPVYIEGKKPGKLSCQEARMLREIEGQLEQVLSVVFGNYKSLDESSVSGIVDYVLPASGLAAPAVEPAVELYKLLHDISSPEAQTRLCQYFQAAARKRSRMHMAETDEYVSSSGQENFVDSACSDAAYQKMETLCLNIKHEIHTDIEIQNQNIIPSFVDLSNLSASIYSTELCNMSSSWAVVSCSRTRNCDIRPPKVHVILGNQVKWAGVKTQHATTPFLDKMYNHLTKTLMEFEVIICRWPEYIFPLENAIADIEKEIVASLEIQYADNIAPLTEIISPRRRISLKYIQKLSQRSVCCFTVSDDLGILMNSLKRMLDVLHPDIEAQMKLCASRLQDNNGSMAPGDRLSEITVLLRAKFRDYTKAIVELLANNMKLQRTTKLKAILQESKNHTESSEIIRRMQPLTNLLDETILHLNKVFKTQVFIQVCRVFWNRMGQEVQSFLDTKKESESWYKGSQIVTSVLDDLFASQMRHLHTGPIELKYLEPPQAVVEVHSMLSK